MKSARLVYIVIILMFILSCKMSTEVIAEGNINLDQSGKLFFDSIENDDFDIALKEVSRTKDTSTLYGYIKKGSSVGGSVFIMCTFCKLSKERGFKYFIIMEEGMDEVGYKYLIGFLNDRTVETVSKLTEFKAGLNQDNIIEVAHFEEFCNKQ